jgi:hypothetical protein
MLISSIPAKFTIPWANSAGGAYIRSIPTPSQIGVADGAASLTDGFPPWCFAAGGAPDGRDFQGILRWVTQWQQWQQAGGPVAYDSAFQTAIGGYPKGAVVASATAFAVSWLSTVDNNGTNPDAGGAGWIKVVGNGPFYAADTGSANALAISVPNISALAAGQSFIVKKSSSANTSAATIIVTGSSGALASTAVVWADGTALASGDWPANVTGLVEYDGAQFNLLSVMGPSVFARAGRGAATNIIPFPSSTAWTVPAGVTSIKRARCWGAGGGGGGSFGAGSGGSGGGGGAYAEAINIPVTPGASITVTVGAAGAAGAGTPTNGGAGGTTSFGSYCSAGGGGGGYSGTGALQSTFQGAGGTATIGSVLLSGAGGGNAYTTGANYGGGIGGQSPFGAGSPSLNLNTAGANGSFPGGGANAGAIGNGGGAGGAGFIIIEY